MAEFWLVLVFAIMASAMQNAIISVAATGSVDVGVCYGLLGNNLPASTAVINLYKQYNISRVRLFDPNPQALNALRGSNIKVVLGVKNEDVPALAASQAAANSWFEANVQPYLNDIMFTHIAVGNEIIPGVYAPYILPAMQFLQQNLDARNLRGIKVTTVIAGTTLGSSYPPSAGAFTPEAGQTLTGILRFLSAQGSPLMANVYPYFARAGDPANVPLDYAQFTATSPVVQDGSLSYFNLFDAMVDAFYSAMESVGANDVSIVVSESGWPSAGNGELTTPLLAATYNRNFVKHVTNNGTPKRPNQSIQGYIFATFNENQKPEGVEQNWGLFYPNMEPVYPFPIA